MLERVLRRYGPEGDQEPGVIIEACRALRAVTLSDDRRKDFSSETRLRVPLYLSRKPTLMSLER